MLLAADRWNLQALATILLFVQVVMSTDKTPKLADLVISRFAQDDVQTYNTVLAGALNISSSRISFISHAGRVGFAFGTNTVARVLIQRPVAGDVNQMEAIDLRQWLVTNVGATQLSNIGVLEVVPIPDSPIVYLFPVYTTFDVLYILLIVAAVLLFVGFVAYLVFRIRRTYQFAAEEAAEAARLKAVDAAKKQKVGAEKAVGAEAGHVDGAGEQGDDDAEGEAELQQLMHKLDDDDEDGTIGRLADEISRSRLARSMMSGRVSASAPPSELSSVATEVRLQSLLTRPQLPEIGATLPPPAKAVPLTYVGAESVLTIPVVRRVVPEHLLATTVPADVLRQRVVDTLTNFKLPPLPGEAPPLSGRPAVKFADQPTVVLDVPLETAASTPSRPPPVGSTRAMSAATAFEML